MMKEEVNEIFEALKGLDIKATPNNVSILDGVFRMLKDIYQKLEEADNGGPEAGAE